MIYVGRSVSSLFQNRQVPAWAQLRTPALHGEILFPKQSNSVLTWGPFTTLPLRWMNSPDLLSKGSRRAAWGSLREGNHFYSHSAWCILTGCINPGSPDRTPALGFANLEKQPDQVCNLGLFLHTQLTVFSPPTHHWCCCCLGITWNVSPRSLSRTPRSAAGWQWRGTMRQPLLCSSLCHCRGQEQEAREQPRQPTHHVTSAGAGAALLPAPPRSVLTPRLPPFVPSPCLTFTNFPGERTRCVSSSSSNTSVLLAKALDSGHFKGHWFWPQSLSTFQEDDGFMSFSTERTGSSVVPLAPLAHTAFYYTHIPVSPPQDAFPAFPGHSQEMGDSSFPLSMILQPTFQLFHNNQPRMLTM